MSGQNLANEPGAWDADFSYGYLARLYAALKRDFAPMRIGDAEQSSAKPRVFVRHDIDVSLDRALPLARLEKEWGVPSTYHVMIDSPFYTPTRATLNELTALGHEVGLHYDVVARGTRDKSPAEREKDIALACTELEAITGRNVKSLSFHLPVADLIRGPLRVGGRVSGYAKELFGWYLSDSRARWREGEPLLSLAKPRGDTLQILMHPIWWAAEHQPPAERLRDFIAEIAPALGKSHAQLSDALWDHIIYRAADPA